MDVVLRVQRVSRMRLTWFGTSDVLKGIDMSLRNVIASATLGAVLLTGIIGICTRMTGANAFYFVPSPRASMSSGECVRSLQSCPMSATEHLKSFFQIYPGIAPESSALAILVIVCLAIVLFPLAARCVRSRAEQYAVVHKRLRFLSVWGIASPVLGNAFRRGILNPRIYA